MLKLTSMLLLLSCSSIEESLQFKTIEVNEESDYFETSGGYSGSSTDTHDCNCKGCIKPSPDTCNYSYILCSSLLAALQCLDDNTTIYIMANSVELHFNALIHHINNVTIVGNNGTQVVFQGNATQMNFIYCSNIKIQGIHWINNASTDRVHITMSRTHNVVIEDSSFGIRRLKNDSNPRPFHVYLYTVYGIVYINRVQIAINFASEVSLRAGITVVSSKLNSIVSEFLDVMVTNCQFIGTDHEMSRMHWHGLSILVNNPVLKLNIKIVKTSFNMSARVSIVVNESYSTHVLLHSTKFTFSEQSRSDCILNYVVIIALVNFPGSGRYGNLEISQCSFYDTHLAKNTLHILGYFNVSLTKDNFSTNISLRCPTFDASIFTLQLYSHSNISNFVYAQNLNFLSNFETGYSIYFCGQYSVVSFAHVNVEHNHIFLNNHTSLVATISNLHINACSFTYKKPYAILIKSHFENSTSNVTISNSFFSKINANLHPSDILKGVIYLDSSASPDHYCLIHNSTFTDNIGGNFLILSRSLTDLADLNIQNNRDIFTLILIPVNNSDPNVSLSTMQVSSLLLFNNIGCMFLLRYQIFSLNVVINITGLIMKQNSIKSNGLHMANYKAVNLASYLNVTIRNFSFIYNMMRDVYNGSIINLSNSYNHSGFFLIEEGTIDGNVGFTHIIYTEYLTGLKNCLNSNNVVKSELLYLKLRAETTQMTSCEYFNNTCTSVVYFDLNASLLVERPFIYCHNVLVKYSSTTDGILVFKNYHSLYASIVNITFMSNYIAKTGGGLSFLPQALYFNTTFNVILQKATFANNKGIGNAIVILLSSLQSGYHNDHCTVTDSLFTDSSFDRSIIYTNGLITLRNSSFLNNRMHHGAAVYFDLQFSNDVKEAVISNCNFSNNIVEYNCLLHFNTYDINPVVTYSNFTNNKIKHDIDASANALLFVDFKIPTKAGHPNSNFVNISYLQFKDNYGGVVAVVGNNITVSCFGLSVISNVYTYDIFTQMLSFQYRTFLSAVIENITMQSNQIKGSILYFATLNDHNMSAAEVFIADCLFTNNIGTGDDYSATIYLSSLNSISLYCTIIDSLFTNNIFDHYIIYTNSLITLKNSDFFNNHGIAVYFDSQFSNDVKFKAAIISNCDFRNNTAEYNYLLHFNTYQYINPIVTCSNFMNNKIKHDIDASANALIFMDFKTPMPPGHPDFVNISYLQFKGNHGGAVAVVGYNITVSCFGLTVISNMYINNIVTQMLSFQYHTSLTAVIANITIQSNQVKGNILYFASLNHLTTSSKVIIADSLFSNNTGNDHGLVIYLSSPMINCSIKTTIFDGNSGDNNCLVHSDSSVNLENVIFTNNDVTAIHITKNTLIFSKGLTLFNNNRGKSAAAIYFGVEAYAIFEESSNTTFTNNTVIAYGGAIYSTLNQKLYKGNLALRVSSNASIKFSNNLAQIAGNSIFFDILESCTMKNECGVIDSIDITQDQVSTSPKKLVLGYPAQSDEVTDSTYYIDNIILGMQTTFSACILDYVNNTAEPTMFRISDPKHHQYHVLYSSEFVMISCDTIIEFSLIGKQDEQNMKFDVNITLQLTPYYTHSNTWKPISVSLVLKVSPCYTGFSYNNELKICVCNTIDNFVTCSGSTAALLKGYWYGIINDHPTVALCPINYCNFEACDVHTGRCALTASPNDQCRKHRIGIACGSCGNGYTLSFDSPDCIAATQCTPGKTILFIVIIFIYWLAIVAVAFALMYFQVEWGYLYGVTFYYSMIDTFLGRNLYISKGLYTFVTVFTSVAKLSPQFLGRFCLFKGMAGIDQEFFHYSHPSAVLIILLIIIIMVRVSPRLAVLLSKVIIPIICFLLLLSYTSLATTSLLLIRYLKFTGINKAFVYISPNMEYFHGRHLGYSLVAIICTVVIVIGLPLLLLSESFLSRKINLIKLKPLLDKFQGCYKDRYRWMAAYYMLCRLVILAIVVSFTTNPAVTWILLFVVVAVMTVIHFTLMPYANMLTCKYDGFVLITIMVVILLQIVEYYNGLSTNLMIGLSVVLVILPVPVLLCIVLMKHNDNIKMAIKLLLKRKSNNTVPSQQQEQINMTDVTSVIDDTVRQNCTTTVV